MRHSLPGTSRVCNLEWQPETASALQESSLRPGLPEAQVQSFASCVPLHLKNLGSAISRVRDIVVILIKEIKEAEMGIESGDFSKSGSGQGPSARGRERRKRNC